MTLAGIRSGDVNQYVTLLQRFLVLNGNLKRDAVGRNPVTGTFSEVTKSAAMDYQRAHDIDVTGIVKGVTWAAIAGVPGPLPVVEAVDFDSAQMTDLFPGDEDALVFPLQRLLFEYGDQPTLAFLPPGIITKADITGVMDSVTVRAVKEFQGNRGITVDGEVGPETWEKLCFPKGRN